VVFKGNVTKLNIAKHKVYVVQYALMSSRNLAPLAAALLKSSALSNKEISEFYDIDIEYKRFDINTAVKRFNKPDILAFSVYLWNFNQSVEVAKRVKRENNKCFIIFGGPSVPIAKECAESIFEKYPFIDMLVCGEGENVFKQILLAFKNKEDFSGIKGLFYKDNGEVLDTGRPLPIKDFSKISSPYLDGSFDKLIQDSRDDFTGFVIETSRGCLYNCTFCYNQVFNRRRWRAMSPDQFKTELEKFTKGKSISVKERLQETRLGKAGMSTRFDEFLKGLGVDKKSIVGYQAGVVPYYDRKIRTQGKGIPLEEAQRGKGNASKGKAQEGQHNRSGISTDAG